MNESNQTGPAALLEQGMALHRAGRLTEAANIYEAIRAADPHQADALHLLGLIAYQLGNLDAAADRIGGAIAERPNQAKFHSNLGNVRAAQGDRAAAAAAYRRALEVDPGFRDARFNLGVMLQEAGDLAGAAEAYAKILDTTPADLDALNNLGLVRLRQGSPGEAAALFRNALAVPAADPGILLNLGSAQEKLGRLADAEASYRTCVQRDPQRAEAHFNLGLVLEQRGSMEEAISAVENAVRLDGSHMAAKAHLRYQYLGTCDWRKVSALGPDIDDLAPRGGGDSRTADAPFMTITHCEDAKRNLAVAHAWAVDLEKQFPPRFDHAAQPRTSGGTPIRLGYLSSAIREHPIAQLMAGLFEAHDRTRFRVHVYSFSHDDGSQVRQRVAAASDSFVDIREATIEQAAERIHADGINILVDLDGWISGNRFGISALRPAPVQATYLGFPASTGAAFIDYAFVDETVVSPAEAATFTENLVYLPHCYLVNDDTQEIAAETMTRADFELPDDAIVLCSFNGSYKINEPTFSNWMEILRAVPDAVLWLSKGNDLTRSNLCAAAAERGINPGRLVFAGRVPTKAQHLRRLQLADLGLDTRIYNGHTTTLDALWAGVPVVAVKGRHFASRVSESLLRAAGLPDLVAEDMDGYRGLAIRLAKDRQALAELRERSWKARATAPLFDTARFTRAIESAYAEMWARHLDGRPPGMIHVADPLERSADQRGERREKGGMQP